MPNTNLVNNLKQTWRGAGWMALVGLVFLWLGAMCCDGVFIDLHREMGTFDINTAIQSMSHFIWQLPYFNLIQQSLSYYGIAETALDQFSWFYLSFGFFLCAAITAAMVAHKALKLLSAEKVSDQLKLSSTEMALPEK